MQEYEFQDDFDDLDDIEGDQSILDEQDDDGAAVLKQESIDEDSANTEYDMLLDDYDDLQDDTDNESTAVVSTLDHFSTNAFGDMEDLLSDFGDENEIAVQDADDAQVLQGLRAKCESLGFTLAPDASVEQAENVFKYAECISKEVQASDRMLEYLNEAYQHSLSDISDSSSMQIKQDTNANQFKARLVNGVHDEGLREVCGKIISFVWDAITNEEKRNVPINDINVNKADIFKSLRVYAQQGFGNISESYLFLHQDSIMNFIDTTITTIKSNKIVGVTLARNAEARKYYVSQRLLSQFFEFIAAYNAKDHSYVERIDTFDGGDITCTCQKCKAKIKVNALMHFMFYNSDGVTRKVAFPEPVICDCGALLTFPISTCLSACQHFAEEHKSEIKAALSHANNFGKGVAVISCTPTVNQLPEELQSIVFDNTSSATFSHTSKKVETFIADDEWLRAVNDFYNHLGIISCHKSTVVRQPQLGIQSVDANTRAPYVHTDLSLQEIGTGVQQSQTDLLSIIAANVAQVAGVDYNTVKGKALVSLLTFLNRNDFLQKTLRFDNIVLANQALTFTKRYTGSDSVDLNRTSKLIFDNLMAIAGIIDKTFTVDGDRNQVLEFLLQHTKELEQYAQKIKEGNQAIWEDIAASKYALAFVPIVDYKQISVYSIIQTIIKEPQFSLINEICDRMIIATYSGEYFKFWCRLNLKHTRTLQTRLLYLADVKQINSAVDLVMNDCFSQFGVYKTGQYFSNIVVQDTEKWKVLKKLAELVSVCNYYRFCKEALNLTGANYGFGSAYDAAIAEFVRRNYSEFANTTNQTEAEFYLRGMFTAEELDAAKEDLSYLVFSRYVPIRLDGESVNDYIKRFKTIDVSNCYDNLSKFSNVKRLGVILFGAALAEARFDNFRVSNFIMGLLDAVATNGSQDALKNIGLSDLRYNMLQKSIRIWTFNDFDVHNADAITLLNAFYMSNAEDAMMNLFTVASDSYFIAGPEVLPLNNTFDFDALLMQQLDTIAKNPEASDMQSMVLELSVWEYTKGYAERFAGE